VQDLAYDEIAEEMGIPRNTVATWLRRALGLLEKSLGAVGPPGAAPVRGAGNGIASQIRAVGRVGR
ncbi:MAG: RNA polymerase sigma factor, partial [Bacillota bacterium]